MHSFDRQRYSVESFDRIFDRAASGVVEDEDADTAAAEPETVEQPSEATSPASGLVEDVDFDTAIAEVLMSLAAQPEAETGPAADEPVVPGAEPPEDAPILAEAAADLGIDDETAPVPTVVIGTAGPAEAGPVPEVFVDEAAPSASIAAPVPSVEAAGIDQPTDEAFDHLDDEDDDSFSEDTARAAEAATFRLLGELERLWQAAA